MGNDTHSPISVFGSSSLKSIILPSPILDLLLPFVCLFVPTSVPRSFCGSFPSVWRFYDVLSLLDNIL